MLAWITAATVGVLLGTAWLTSGEAAARPDVPPPLSADDLVCPSDTYFEVGAALGAPAAGGSTSPEAAYARFARDVLGPALTSGVGSDAVTESETGSDAQVVSRVARRPSMIADVLFHGDSWVVVSVVGCSPLDAPVPDAAGVGAGVPDSSGLAPADLVTSEQPR